MGTPLLTWPIGHGGWFFSEPAEYEAHAASFLAAGVPSGEQVWFVADDPRPSRWPHDLLHGGVLVLASLDDAYGPLRAGDLDKQRSVFANAVDEALANGYSGIRVVADNTRLISEDLNRWIEWESVVDRFIAENPVTGLCGIGSPSTRFTV